MNIINTYDNRVLYFVISSIFIMFLVTTLKFSILQAPLIVIHVLFLFLYRLKIFKIDIESLLFFSLFVFLFFQSIYLVDSLVTALQALTIIFFYYLFYCFSKKAALNVTDNDLKRLSRTLFFIVPLFYITLNTWSGIRLGGLFSNPNVTAHFLIVMSPLIFLRTEKIRLYIVIAFILLLIILTGSRSGLLAFVLGLVVYSISLKVKMTFLKSTIFLLVTTFLSYKAVDIAIEIYSYLFLKDSESRLLYTGYNNRDLIMTKAIDRFNESPFFGQGFDAAKFEVNGHSFGTHNGYLEVLIKTGYIGFMILIVIILTFIYKICKSSERKEKAAALMTLTIILSLATNTTVFFVFNYYFLYLILIYTIAVYSSPNKNIE